MAIEARRSSAACDQRFDILDFAINSIGCVVSAISSPPAVVAVRSITSLPPMAQYGARAGMSAGIDLALALVEADFRREMARETAKLMVVYHRRAGGKTRKAPYF